MYSKYKMYITTAYIIILFIYIMQKYIYLSVYLIKLNIFNLLLPFERS